MDRRHTENRLTQLVHAPAQKWRAWREKPRLTKESKHRNTTRRWGVKHPKKLYNPYTDQSRFPGDSIWDTTYHTIEIPTSVVAIPIIILVICVMCLGCMGLYYGLYQPSVIRDVNIYTYKGRTLIHRDGNWIQTPNLTTAKLMLGANDSPKHLHRLFSPKISDPVSGIPGVPDVNGYRPPNGSNWGVCSIAPVDGTPATTLTATPLMGAPHTAMRDTNIIVQYIPGGLDSPQELWLLSMMRGDRHRIITDNITPQAQSLLSAAVPITDTVLTASVEGDPIDATVIDAQSVRVVNTEKDAICYQYTYWADHNPVISWVLKPRDNLYNDDTHNLFIGEANERSYTTNIPQSQGWLITTPQTPNTYFYLSNAGIYYQIGGADPDRDMKALGLMRTPAQEIPKPLLDLFEAGPTLSHENAMR